MRRILVIGSSNTDMVIKSDRLPKPGETLLGGKFMMNPGGKGANQAVAASRLGGNVTFVCKVGRDTFGKKACELFKEEGIDVSHILEDPEGNSGVALINVDSKGENSIVVAESTNDALTSKDIESLTEVIKASDILVLQLEIPMESVVKAAEIAHAHGKKVILNPAPAPSQGFPAGFLSNIDLIVPNETEASIISGIEVQSLEDAKRAANKIQEAGCKKVIVTLGSRGAMIANHEITVVPSDKVEAVDTTAAGDTFCGALAVALSENMSLEEGTRFACHASAISVIRMGAQSSIPYRYEIK